MCARHGRAPAGASSWDIACGWPRVARPSAAWLRPYLLGWKAYFRWAQTPRVWRELDEWLRHRLRAIQLKHCKRGTTPLEPPGADPHAGG